MRKAPVFNNKCDIWALGCILFELVTEEKLFLGDWQVMKFNDSGSIDVVRGKLCEVEDVTVVAFLPSVQTMLSLICSDRPPADVLERSFETLRKESRIPSESTIATMTPKLSGKYGLRQKKTNGCRSIADRVSADTSRPILSN